MSARDRLTEDDALLLHTDLLALAQRCHPQTLGRATWANSRARRRLATWRSRR